MIGVSYDPNPLDNAMYRERINGSKHIPVLNGLNYDMARLFDSFVPR